MLLKYTREDQLDDRERVDHVSAKTENLQTVRWLSSNRWVAFTFKIHSKANWNPVGMCTEKTQNRSGNLLLFSIFSSSLCAFSYSFSYSFSSTSSLWTVFLHEHFPHNSFDIAFSDEVLEVSPQICTRISIFSHTSRAFLLLSKLVLECASHPSLAEKPAADKKRKTEVCGGESPDEDREERRERIAGAGGTKEGGRLSLLFARIQFPAVFA